MGAGERKKKSKLRHSSFVSTRLQLITKSFEKYACLVAIRSIICICVTFQLFISIAGAKHFSSFFSLSFHLSFPAKKNVYNAMSVLNMNRSLTFRLRLKSIRIVLPVHLSTYFTHIPHIKSHMYSTSQSYVYHKHTELGPLLKLGHFW